MIVAFTIELPPPIDLDSNEKWEVGLCKISYPPSKLGILKAVSVVGFYTALMYCDPIATQHVGNALFRCLRTLINPTLHGEHVYYNIYYVPVEKQTIKIFG